MSGIHKRFPGVHALKGVNFVLHKGEVVALMGENGAGKSTLMKIIGGAHLPDAGTIQIGEEQVTIPSPTKARELGIAMIYQEFNLIPALSAVENVFLGQEITRAGFIHKEAERDKTLATLHQLGMDFDPDLPCHRLTVAQQQTVEIARALLLKARILVLDEPSAVLTPREVEKLFNIIHTLRKQGLGLVYIGHRLDEIFKIADRVTVMRDGANVGNQCIADCSRTQLIKMMVGRALEDEFPPRRPRTSKPMLEISCMSREPRVKNVSFEARGGEILAFAGLVGAGRTELARLIFGADKRDSGRILLNGKVLSIQNPRDAIEAGIGLMTEDRKLQGLILPHSLRDNFGLPNLNQFAPNGFIRTSTERRAFHHFASAMQIKISDENQRAGHLSGGNQQKLVIAKWLARQCDVLIFDEPTRGIDVGAKYEIYQLINDLANEGKAIIMVSSELPEILGMADRILVMREGEITGEINDASKSSQEAIMHFAVA
ncbi:MAG: sugar ABC transporter ATP-binding protein [Verrucomicrobiota bacterium]|nr:sugar ABC transporter ATP-binding protein [Verrucomicrobiota bacterium]